MRKFTIIHNLTATVAIEVLAETREEAFKKASKNNIDPRDYDFELDSAEIGHEEEVPDLQGLIEKAEAIIKKADEEDDEITLFPWPLVTVESWDGSKMEYHHQRMSLLYWDYEVNEIGFNTEESSGDFYLSELPEIEQFEICNSIGASAKPCV